MKKKTVDLESALASESLLSAAFIPFWLPRRAGGWNSALWSSGPHTYWQPAVLCQVGRRVYVQVEAVFRKL